MKTIFFINKTQNRCSQNCNDALQNIGIQISSTDITSPRLDNISLDCDVPSQRD